MPTALLIREANPADIAFIVDANHAMALETEHRQLDRGRLERGVAALFEAPQRGFYLLAEQAGQRVGCVLITHEWSDWRNGDWWWLQSVYVLPQARRGGVFRALHAEVERRARQTPGVIGLRLYVERDNAVAQATYVQLGFGETTYHLLECGFAGGVNQT